jgi:hypothetical protein
MKQGGSDDETQERRMEHQRSLTARWDEYRPWKAVWFWSCAAGVAATLVIGFTWGGWMTSGTAATMSAESAQQAKAQLVAAYCVDRFDAAPDASAKLAALKGADSWRRADFIGKGGWAKMPGVEEDIVGAADLCAQRLVSASAAPAKSSGSSS